MNKTKDDLIDKLLQINKVHPNYLRQLAAYNVDMLHFIKNRCMKFKCSNLDRIIINNYLLYICYDDFSDLKLGWHPIYCDTFDFCSDSKHLVPNENCPICKGKGFYPVVGASGNNEYEDCSCLHFERL